MRLVHTMNRMSSLLPRAIGVTPGGTVPARSQIGPKIKQHGLRPAPYLSLSWSGRRDLNPRPQRPERCALNQAAPLPDAVSL